MLIICAETEEENKRRFEIELEFVQCLSNPHYLNCESYYVFRAYYLFVQWQGISTLSTPTSCIDVCARSLKRQGIEVISVVEWDPSTSSLDLSS